MKRLGFIFLESGMLPSSIQDNRQVNRDGWYMDEIIDSSDSEISTHVVSDVELFSGIVFVIVFLRSHQNFITHNSALKIRNSFKL